MRRFPVTTSIYYGDSRYDASVEDAPWLEKMIKHIVASRATEWLPLIGKTSTGEFQAIKLLITPGVPIYLMTTEDTQVDDQLKTLNDKYITGWDAPDE